MQPTLESGSFVLIKKWTYNIHLPFSTYEILYFRRPKLGEGVAFVLPEIDSEMHIKRVVGLEGQKISIESGTLMIDGQKAQVSSHNSSLQETLPNTAATSYKILLDRSSIRDYGPIDIPSGYFFVLNDNRNVGGDSRDLGPIPYAYLRGEVMGH